MKTGSINNFIMIFRHTAVAFILFIVLFAGCRAKTPPVLFYTLSPVHDMSGQEDQDLKLSPAGKDISIGVGPASLPDFLNKPQIVERKSPGRISYSEFHRWGGYLDKDFLRVMSENLSFRLATDQVRIFPWIGQKDPMFEVEFDVRQFDGELTGEVILNVIWKIRDNSDPEKPVLSRRSVIREPVNALKDKDYEAMVAAQSRALGRLSDEIANELKKRQNLPR